MLSRPQSWFVATLLIVALVACWHAQQMSRHAHDVSRAGNEQSQLPVAHQLIRPEFTADGHLWIQYAERLASGESLRIRETHIDNAPDGREVHWNNGYAWWLALCGRVSAWSSGAPLPRAMENAALWANLPLLLAGLAAIAWCVTRRQGPAAAAVAVLALFGNRSFYGGFWPGNTDHHGIAALALVGCVFAAFALIDTGEATTPDDARLRRAALWSSIWGGVAMWISAATTIPVLAGLALGALVAARCGGESASARAAEAWRLWGRVGAITSLAFYALEYFPGHLGWRLEVNHPLYAAAWWASAEFLSALLPHIRKSAGAKPSSIVPTTLWSLPLALLPAGVIALWREEVFQPFDHLVAGLHGLILEFLPLWTRFAFEGITGNYEILLVIPAFYALAFWLWLTRPADRAAIAFASVLLGTAHVFGIWQARWTGNAIAGEFLLALMVVRPWETGARFSRLALAGVILLATAPDVLPRVWEALELRSPTARMPGDDRQLLLRQTAAVLRTQAPSGDVVVWSTPNTALDLAFYGGFQTVGTLYWENRLGLHAMARLAAASSDTEAEALVRRHAITHFVFCTEDDVLDEIVHFVRPQTAARERNQAFAPRIFRTDEIPAWLHALPDITPAAAPGSMRVQVFAVDFAQSAAEAQFHLGNVLAQRGGTARALAAFTRSAALGFAPAALRRAEFLIAAQQWSEAIPALDQAIAGAPAAARYRLLTQAGESLANGRQHEAAARFFERALHEQVTDTRAANGLAWLLATSAASTPVQRDFAVRLAQQSTRLDPMVPEGWSALAAALAATGDRAGALRALERAEKLVAADAAATVPQRLAAQRAAYLAGRLYRD